MPLGASRHRPLSGFVRSTALALALKRLIARCIRPKSRPAVATPVLRLLFVGVALVLRNVWVWLHAEVLRNPGVVDVTSHAASLRFNRMLLWLVVEVAQHYRLLRGDRGLLAISTRWHMSLGSFSTTEIRRSPTGHSSSTPAVCNASLTVQKMLEAAPHFLVVCDIQDE